MNVPFLLYAFLVSVAAYLGFCASAIILFRLGFSFSFVLVTIPVSVGVILFVIFEAIGKWVPKKERAYKVSIYERVFHLVILVGAAFFSVILFSTGKTLYLGIALGAQAVYSVIALYRSTARQRTTQALE